MWLKSAILFVFFGVIISTEAFVRRDVTATPPNVLESFQRNIEQFKNCLDTSLAKAVGDVNEKQLQPIFNIIGDQLNRVNKAYEDITAPQRTPYH